MTKRKVKQSDWCYKVESREDIIKYLELSSSSLSITTKTNKVGLLQATEALRRDCLACLGPHFPDWAM